eukprot:CAMPEP_0202849262 /NCGR_PEP_ID=MMETSP1389-20130828/80204_1 /ASSEMBLY_ACC=CAM_ASM_000865 /TAXON_ID=302021 /ORGANISM="Rhodomonas sp., Strain CCMP768" /LENGTH=54 /DNA_ID=CAMNT_0049527247 /DNA_START=282 /DNA_END=443 /DNA_ORIENTATION=-
MKRMREGLGLQCAGSLDGTAEAKYETSSNGIRVIELDLGIQLCCLPSVLAREAS